MSLHDHPSGVGGYVLLRDEKANATDAGTFTSGAWRTRTLNTKAVDLNGDCTLASNQLTFLPGAYLARIKCPAFLVDYHKARLYNVTDSATLLVGTAEYSYSGANVAGESWILGRFVIAASKLIEVQHRCVTTRSGNGLGLSSAGTLDEVEVYTIAEFWRIAA